MKRLLASCILALVIPFSVAAATVDDITALAESGNADAQFSLAEKYEKGDGISKDETTAALWYGKAADLGHVEAKLKLGRLYLSGRGVAADNCRGLYFIESAAELGNVDAQFLTGRLYRGNRCGESNTASAKQWLALADANGNRLAAASLALDYLMGDFGFEKDYQKSVFWFRKAITYKTSSLEMASNAFMIGTLYYQGGYGITQDTQEAMNWFYTAARIAEHQKPTSNPVVLGFYNEFSAAKSKVNITAPDYRKVIASAAADDWWQHNSGLVLAD